VAAQNLIVDSLAYWRNTLGVDGYRFDLASVLGNTCQHGCYNFDKMDSGNALNRIVAELPPRPAAGGTGTDLIAEPWAIGGNSYQVGGFPSGWAEWNGAYRDTLRQAQNKLGSVAVTTGQMARRFAGSSDLYGDDGRKPWHSINFMTAHDGFTLKDLYSCNSKNNGQAWPYGVSDGGDDNNNSWDQGGIAADQRKAARNGFALMMVSAGTPMMVGGDEALRSLNCNNNPYNLDSSANWLNWTCHGTAALVQAGRERRRCDLLQRRQQPCDRLADRRQRVWRHGFRHLCRAQYLERPGQLRAAMAGHGQELVSRYRHLRLGRRHGPGQGAGFRRPAGRREHELWRVRTRNPGADREIAGASATRAGACCPTAGGRASPGDFMDWRG
jgi:pullulanase/glycogen debranching enzyme